MLNFQGVLSTRWAATSSVAITPIQVGWNHPSASYPLKKKRPSIGVITPLGTGSRAHLVLSGFKLFLPSLNKHTQQFQSLRISWDPFFIEFLFVNSQVVEGPRILRDIFIYMYMYILHNSIYQPYRAIMLIYRYTLSTDSKIITLDYRP